MPVLATLTLLFVGLKLTGYIAWSWLWVLSPVWISALFAVGMLAGFALLGRSIRRNFWNRR